MAMDVFYYSDRGTRLDNEDFVSFRNDEKSALAIVADGLGGYENGELASRKAAEVVSILLEGKEPSESALCDAVCRASREVFALGGPRTTIAALWLNGQRAVAAHVGDSRIYQFRRGGVLFQSVDHSMAQLSVMMGEIAPEELRKSSGRSKLIRVLGEEEPPGVDVVSLQPQKGDRFLLCSDGFWGPVWEEEMVSAMERTDTAEEWLRQMRQLVEREACAGSDNHSAVGIVIG